MRARLDERVFLSALLLLHFAFNGFLSRWYLDLPDRASNSTKLREGKYPYGMIRGKSERHTAYPVCLDRSKIV